MAEQKIVNGVDVKELARAVHEFRQDPELGAFQFRVRNVWQDGGRSQSTVEQFYGAKQENDGRHFELGADEPSILLGKDSAPNPVEHLLHALACCLTSSLVYHAAARGISIEACECELRGQLDLRGFFGIADDVRKGYERIEATFRVKSDGDPRVLEECARFSPVLDVVSHGTEVDLQIMNEPRAARVEKPAAPEAPTFG